MSFQPATTISDVLEEIESRRLLLPAIQREFVWVWLPRDDGSSSAWQARGVVPRVLGVQVNVSAVKAAGYRASQLIGATVYNDKNKAIGSVNDLIVSGDGQVNLAIIDVGGFLGLGAKHVAVPTKLFERGAQNTVVLPKATQKELQAMPAFHYTR